MTLLYNIGIRIYWLMALIVSPWNRKAKLWVRGRRQWYEKLKKAMDGDQKMIWFHCASLGEFEQGRPVMEEMRKRRPSHKILLTFFSPSGYEKRKDYAGADYVMYLPLDTRRNAKKMLDLLQLEMVFFIKYEFWYHFLQGIRKKEVPLYLASGNFRPGQLFFRRYGGWYRKFLFLFTHIFVQNNESGELLSGIGLHRFTVAGDTRFDRVYELLKDPFRHPALERFAREKPVIVAGSTWEKDEQYLAQAFGELSDELRWVIAPHELSESHIRSLQERFPGSVLYTELGEMIPEGTRVILVNTIGTLSYLYRYGTLAYIGGGFGRGIHNILEAATYGLPVIFGPEYGKFSEALELSSLGGAFPIANEAGLLFTIRQQLENPKLLKTTSQIAANYVSERVGATSVILEKCV
ncbi:MAG: glycosyltransferase N-terminal domain-containing protein [Bacteroidales bacterium]|nr:glycosyltransferase N-terminal domain-containing protein [Bacteroidales bacterium]